MLRPTGFSFFICATLAVGLYANNADPINEKRILAGCGATYTKLYDDLYSPVTYSGFLVPISLGYESRKAILDIKMNYPEAELRGIEIKTSLTE